MDMRTGFSLSGAIELGMMAVAGAQMAHFYNVPVSLHGPWTDSMLHDGQSTFERTYMNFMAAFAGANVLVGAGMMQQSLVTSHEQLVIDSEINKTVIRALQGFDADEGHLAMEAIARVGPGGNFIQDPHTLKYLRGERYKPSPLIYRDSRDAWTTGGGKTFEKRANEIARTILKEHEPLPLPEDVSQALDKLVSDAMKSLKK
jgi:trimethylamine--corrinoid protein Co-methyltransferase